MSDVQRLYLFPGLARSSARVTEMRFFVGLQENEIAQELGISEITAKRDWKFARAWLASYLSAQ